MGGGPPVCDDGMACTEESCDPALGCRSSQTLSDNGVTLTLFDVSSCGTLNVVSPAACPLAPAFEFSLCGACYNVTTQVTFSGEVEICIDYSGLSCPTPPQIHHFDDSSCPPGCPGQWEPLTTTSDNGTEICAISPSLSEFALFVPVERLPSLSRRAVVIAALLLLASAWAVQRRVARRHPG